MLVIFYGHNFWHSQKTQSQSPTSFYFLFCNNHWVWVPEFYCRFFPWDATPQLFENFLCIFIHYIRTQLLSHPLSFLLNPPFFLQLCPFTFTCFQIKINNCVIKLSFQFTCGKMRNYVFIISNSSSLGLIILPLFCVVYFFKIPLFSAFCWCL